MPLSSTDVWKLLVDSRLVVPEQVALLQTKYNQAVGDEDATSVARWLVEGNIVSRYQAKILLSGRAGPFQYGEYRIYDRINQGRLSGAFHAIHEATQHPVMLYFLSGRVSQDPELWRQAIQRTASLTGLRHTNVQRWFQLVDLTTFKFLVGENLSGICLTDHLGENRLPVKRACGLIRQAAHGLAALHQQGWIHGDVRPWNVWSNSSGQVQVLIDPTESPVTPQFGAADPDNQLLARSDYLAPELTQPHAQLTVLTDIYALGCTFYHLLTGRAPFAGGDVAQKMGRHATEAIQPLEPFGVAPDVAKLVAFMMAKNPQIRIASCADIVQALGPYADTPKKATPPDLPSLAAFEKVVQAAPTPPLATAAVAAPVVVSPAPVIQPVATSQPVVPAAAPQPTAAPAELAAIAVKDGGPRLATRHRSRAARKKQRRLAMIVTAAGVLLLATGLWVFRGRLGWLPDAPDAPDVAQNNADDPEQPSEITNTGTSNTSSDRTGELVGRFQVVADDGRQLWLPPTTGDPIDLKYVPQGGQLFLIVRPSDLAATPEGPGILQSLGPHFETLRNDWLAASGVGWEQIEQLVVSLHDNADEFPRPLFVVHMAEPFDPVAIQQGWGNPSSEQHNQAALFATAKWAYWIPADAENRVFVMGHADDVREAIDLAGAAPTLRREVARLLQSSDADRHLTLLFTPGFLTTELFRDGRSFYFGSPRRLRNALQWFLDEGIKAGMWSIHLGETAYSEVRFYGQADYDHHELAAGFRDRLQALPERIESYMVRINPPEYWKVVAFRYPQMVRFLHRYCRVGVEDEQAIINVVLPAQAPQNLILGGELVLASVPGAAAVEVATPTVQTPQTLAELLATKTSFTFDQTSLESALRDLAVSLSEEYPGLPFTFDIKILGPDLEAGGITRNQQVRDFNQRDATVSQILTALVMKANPITTVKQPSELDQKLIWVVAADPDNPAQQVVLITTRDAAATKQYTLPEPFQSPDTGQTN